MSLPSYLPPEPPAPQCYRHRGAATYIRCQRCSRPICPQCMTAAAVGYQCPDCVAQGRRSTRQNRNPFGGERARNPMTTTIVLTVANVAVWVGILLTGQYSSLLYQLFRLTPLGACVPVGQPDHVFVGVGPQYCPIVGGAWEAGVATGGYWQVLTSVFTHVEVLHIGCNMLCLWFLGPGLEWAVGRVRFLVLYFLAGLAGSAAVLWFSDPDTATVGASGAVFGLMGALLVLAWKVRGDVRTVLMWLGINLVYTFSAGNVSWQGHLGGLVGGAAVAAVIVFAPRANRERWQWTGFAALALLTVVAIATRAAMLA